MCIVAQLTEGDGLPRTHQEKEDNSLHNPSQLPTVRRTFEILGTLTTINAVPAESRHL